MASPSGTPEMAKVFVETEIDTRLLLTVPRACTVKSLQGYVEGNHQKLFPEAGEVSCRRLEYPAQNGKAFALVGATCIRDLLDEESNLRLQAILEKLEQAEEGPKSSFKAPIGNKRRTRSKSSLGVANTWTKSTQKDSRLSKDRLSQQAEELPIANGAARGGPVEEVSRSDEQPSSMNRTSRQNGTSKRNEDRNNAQQQFSSQREHSRGLQPPVTYTGAHQPSPTQTKVALQTRNSRGRDSDAQPSSQAQPSGQEEILVQSTFPVANGVALAGDDGAESSEPDSDAETQATGSGRAMLEVVPETQPTLSQPGYKQDGSTRGKKTRDKGREPAIQHRADQHSLQTRSSDRIGPPRERGLKGKDGAPAELPTSSKKSAGKRPADVDTQDEETLGHDLRSTGTAAQSSEEKESSENKRGEAANPETAKQADEEEGESSDDEEEGEEEKDSDNEQQAVGRQETSSTDIGKAHSQGSEEQAESPKKLAAKDVRSNQDGLEAESDSESDSESESESDSDSEESSESEADKSRKALGSGTNPPALGKERSTRCPQSFDEGEEEESGEEEEEEDEEDTEHGLAVNGQNEQSEEESAEPQEQQGKESEEESGGDEAEQEPSPKLGHLAAVALRQSQKEAAEAKLKTKGKKRKRGQTDVGKENGPGGEDSESEEQYLIRTKQIVPGHPQYLRTLRLSAIHEEAKRKGKPYPKRLKHAGDPDQASQEEQPSSPAQNASQKKKRKKSAAKEAAAQEADPEAEEEADAVKGICASAKVVLQKPMSSYPSTNEGRKEMLKTLREAFRDQMAYEGKSKSKLFSAEKPPHWWPLEKWDCRQLDSIKNATKVLAIMKKQYLTD